MSSPIATHPIRVETRYKIIDENGRVVREGAGILRDSAMVGTTEVVYEELSDLPVGSYTIQPAGISLEVRPSAESV